MCAVTGVIRMVRYTMKRKLMECSYECGGNQRSKNKNTQSLILLNGCFLCHVRSGELLTTHRIVRRMGLVIPFWKHISFAVFGIQPAVRPARHAW